MWLEEGIFPEELHEREYNRARKSSVIGAQVLEHLPELLWELNRLIHRQPLRRFVAYASTQILLLLFYTYVQHLDRAIDGEPRPQSFIPISFT